MVKIGIFILATGRKAGGPETYEVQLIRGLSRIDKQNQYFIYCTSVEAEKIIGVHQPNVTYRVLRPAARAISVAITLPRWMASDGLDFFHSTYAPPPLPNKPFVFTMHCASNFEHPEFYPTFIRWRLNGLHRVALRRAGFFLCVSNFVARYLKERVKLPAERLAITYHGVGAEFSLACRKDARRILAEQIGLHDPFLLHVGKVQARKNIVGLIHAYARFRKETPCSRAKLVLAGKKVETSEGVDEAIAALGLQEEVLQLGYVPQSLLPSLYGAAEMLVFPSFYEGFGIPLLEAMACGCPVVSSNATSLPEAAGDAALLVDPNSTEQIAAAMAEITGNPEKRIELIERGLRRAPLFTWENCARKTLEAYRKFHQELNRAGK